MGIPEAEIGNATPTGDTSSLASWSYASGDCSGERDKACQHRKGFTKRDIKNVQQWAVGCGKQGGYLYLRRGRFLIIHTAPSPCNTDQAPAYLQLYMELGVGFVCGFRQRVGNLQHVKERVYVQKNEVLYIHTLCEMKYDLKELRFCGC